ncbi:hypothetical protein BA190_24025 [Labrys sp. WJW]|nr:hypothetical protein BA190_24025 [Labrys sp. WJW]
MVDNSKVGRKARRVKLPALRIENGTAFAKSKDIAEVFDKGHKEVLRDIRAVFDLARKSALYMDGWFRATT